MNTAHKIILGTGIALFAFSLSCRFSKTIADFYALNLYPRISAATSWLASPFQFSLQGIVFCLIVIAFVAIILIAIAKRWKFSRWFSHEFTLILWTVVWVYMGWANNYGRSTMYERLGLKPAQYNKEQFVGFINNYVDKLNEYYTEIDYTSAEAMEQRAQEYFSKVPQSFGLCQPMKYHHAKKMPYQRVFSGMGVLGFIGPLFAEQHVNSDTPPFKYPFVYLHEYSHVLGASSEAEANFWAFVACQSSYREGVRYSGYYSLLRSVMLNAQSVLTRDEYDEWLSRIRPEVMFDLQTERNTWARLRMPTMDKLQTRVYDLFLKGNKIPTGIGNYSEVVGMLITVDIAGKI